MPDTPADPSGAPILQVVTRMVRGGAQLIVLELCHRLRELGHRVELATGPQTGDEGSLWAELDELGIPTHTIPTLAREISPAADFRAYRALRALIRDLRPAVVHSHTSKAGLIGTAAARRERVPGVVFSPHGHILGAGAQIPGVPSGGPKRWLLARAARLSADLAHTVVCPNEAERADGIAHRMWTDRSSVAIPNGIDVERFVPGDRIESRAILGLPFEGPVVGVVARLTVEKGVDLALETIAKLEGVSLVVIGDGPERERLTLRAQAKGLAGRVHFVGVRPDVHRILPAFDVVIAPSRTEAHGLAVAEAQACGVPVVSSDIGGLRSLVVEDETGLRVPVGDISGYREAVERILVDEPLRARPATTARAHVEENFSLDRMVELTANAYRKLVPNAFSSPAPKESAPSNSVLTV